MRNIFILTAILALSLVESLRGGNDKNPLINLLSAKSQLTPSATPSSSPESPPQGRTPDTGVSSSIGNPAQSVNNSLRRRGGVVDKLAKTISKLNKNPLLAILAINTAIAVITDDGSQEQKRIASKSLFFNMIKLAIIIPEDIDTKIKQKRLQFLNSLEQSIGNLMDLIYDQEGLVKDETKKLSDLMLNILELINMATGGAAELPSGTKEAVKSTAESMARMLNDPTRWKEVLGQFNRWLSEVLQNAVYVNSGLSNF